MPILMMMDSLMVMKPTPENLLMRKTPALTLTTPIRMAMVTVTVLKWLEARILMTRTAKAQSLLRFFMWTLKMVRWIPVIREMMGMLTVTSPLMQKALRVAQLHLQRETLTEVTSTSLALISLALFRTLRERTATRSRLGSSPVT